MIISPEILEAYNHITQEQNDSSQAIIKIHIGAAQQIINDYVGFNCEEILSNSDYDEAAISMFQNVALRIATLLQLEDGSNIGVSVSGEFGTSRSFLNVVDYTPYLKPLSAFRKNTEM